MLDKLSPDAKRRQVKLLLQSVNAARVPATAGGAAAPAATAGGAGKQRPRDQGPRRGGVVDSESDRPATNDASLVAWFKGISFMLYFLEAFGVFVFPSAPQFWAKG
jgi:hypothetical protein